MSWDSYIDNLLGHGSGNIDKGCIISLDGGKWTTDAHANAFKITQDEAVKIANGMRTKDFSTFQASGIVCEGIKYQFLREQDGTEMYGKKKDYGTVSFYATTKAIVCAHCPEGKSAGACNTALSKIADYLRSTGY